MQNDTQLLHSGVYTIGQQQRRTTPSAGSPSPCMVCGGVYTAIRHQAVVISVVIVHVMTNRVAILYTQQNQQLSGLTYSLNVTLAAQIHPYLGPQFVVSKLLHAALYQLPSHMHILVTMQLS